MITHSFRKIRKAVIESGLLDHIEESKDFTPDTNDICFEVGKGLIIYRPKGDSAEIYAALYPNDVGEGFFSEIDKQWQLLKEFGYKRVYCEMYQWHKPAACLCGAYGMKRRLEGGNLIYEAYL